MANDLGVVAVLLCGLAGCAPAAAPLAPTEVSAPIVPNPTRSIAPPLNGGEGRIDELERQLRSLKEALDREP